MSLGYAEKLSYREDLGGQLGAPELYDGPEEVENKAEQLAELVRGARRIIAFTGAGISTTCGIPDFRGPSGIWTLQRAGQPLPCPKVSFTHAKPSLTHQVLVALISTGKLDYLVSQNVDGLHLRSGIPRECLAELHGNCFAERCRACGTEYVRDFEVETVGFKCTGRKCSQSGCGAALRDHILDWEDPLPEDELKLSESHAKEADLAICLGTSLQITPACNLPLKATRVFKGGTKEQPGQLAIINLQRTQHDNKAVKSGGLVCHARCDDIMRLLVRKLRLAVPQYVRRDAVVVGHQQHSTSVMSGLAQLGLAAETVNSSAEEEASAPVAAEEAPAASDGGNAGTSSSSEGGRGSVAVSFSLFVQSSHGAKCPMPMVQAVHISFEDQHLKPATLKAPPFIVRRTARREGPMHASITLHLHAAADEDKRTVELSYMAHLEAGVPARASRQEERHEFVTQVASYDNGSEGGSDEQEPVAVGGPQEEAAAVAAVAGIRVQAADTREKAAAAVGLPQLQQQPVKKQVKKQRVV